MGSNVSKIGTTKKKKSGSGIDKTLIGVPTEFRHIYHVGTDPNDKRDQRPPVSKNSGSTTMDDHFGEPSEVLRKQLLEITERLQQLTPPPVRRSATVGTPISIARKPVAIPAALTTQQPATVSSSSFHKRRPDHPWLTPPSLDDSIVPTHKMSMMKWYVESKIESQVQKHARKRSKSWTMHRLHQRQPYHQQQQTLVE
ncbi:hypothetical protein VTP01DRAFT_4354 [Rhizomucor pusillus]|uniref:uncharacterized protein n=1 Tax=Rhizomucor pusillus TaxID=4840 RepID=UPI0037444832